MHRRIPRGVKRLLYGIRHVQKKKPKAFYNAWEDIDDFDDEHFACGSSGEKDKGDE